MASEQTPLLSQDKHSKKARRQRCRLKRPFSVAVAAVFALCFSAVLFLRSQRSQIPKRFTHDFGVGFDFTASYGTAAVNYPNGTNENIIKLDASPEYQKMMARASLESSRHPHPPYTTPQQEWSDKPRRLRRLVRKALGLPASPEVHHLALLLCALRTGVEQHLNRTIDGGVATMPNLPGLHDEDLADAFAHAGLLYASAPPYRWFGYTPETGCAYAGHGFGLCSNYADVELCRREARGNRTAGEYVLAVAYTRGLLAVSYAPEGFGFGSEDGEGVTHLAEARLGWERRREGPGADYYYEAVRDALMAPWLRDGEHRWRPRRTGKVILHGESVGWDARFEEVFREVVDEIAPGAPVFAEDPVYVAARGAAYIAKVVLYYHRIKDGGLHLDRQT